MALEKSIVSVDLMHGLDRKHDSKTQKIPGKLVTLENGVFVDADTIAKGGGYSALPATQVSGANTLPQAFMLATRGQDLLQFSSGAPDVWLYSPHANRWAAISSDFQPTTLTKQAVVRNNYTQSAFDAATVGGVSLWAYSSSETNLLRYVLVDEVTGSILQTPRNLSAGTAFLPRVLVCNSRLCVIYEDSLGNLRMNVLGGTVAGVVPPPVDGSTGALWRMDEASGDSMADATGNGTTLTSVSATTAGVTGQAGLARSFAAGSEVSGRLSPALQAALNSGFARSFSFWVFRTGSSNGVLLRAADGDSENIRIGIDDGSLGAAGHLYVQWLALSDNGEYGSFTRVGALIPANVWSQVVIAITVDTSNAGKCLIKMYLNGLVASMASPGDIGPPISVSDGFMYVGGAGGPASGTFVGVLDEIEIVSRAMTQADAKARTVGRIVDPGLGADLVLETNTDAALNIMDAVTDGASIWVAYARTGDDFVAIIKTDETGAVSATTNVTAQAAADACHLNLFSGGNVGLVYSNNAANGVRIRIFANDLSSVIATSTLDGTTGSTLLHITSFQNGTGLTVLWDVGSGLVTASIKSATVGPTGSVTVAAAKLILNASLAGNAFLLNGLYCVAVVFSSPTQPTLFVYGISGAWAGKLLATALSLRSGGAEATMRLPSILYSGEHTVALPASERGRLALFGATDITSKGLSRLELGDYSTHARQFVEVSGCTFLTGGLPAWFDGQSIVEHGFALYPRVEAPTDAGAGGALSAGVYHVKACWEWTDAQGNLFRSAPVDAGAVTLLANHKLTYTIVTLTHSRKSGVVCAIFRTEANGSIYYRVFPQGGTSAFLNDPTVNVTTSVADNVADVDLIANEILYTTGGALAEGAAPACSSCCLHQGRIVVGGLEQPHEAWYTKLPVPQSGPGFSDALTLELDPLAGPITALASLDDALVLFKETQAYVVPGQGPDDTGSANGYGSPQLVSVDVGCLPGAAKAVLRLPDGLMFPAQKGLRMLAHGFQVSPVGADVDPLAVGILAGVLDGKASQARFYLADGSVLVWDYLWKQWSVLTGHQALDAVLWRSQATHLQADGSACVSDGSPTHNGTAIALKLETSWLSFAGVQGFERIWKMLVLGTFLAPSTLAVELAYDFEAFEVLPAPSPAASVASLPTWRLDEASGNALDVNAAVNLVDHGGCGSVSGKVGTARSFGGINQYFASAYAGTAAQIAHRLLVLGEWTVGGWLKPSALAPMVLLEFAKDAASGLAADNELLKVIMTSGGFLAVEWQHGAGQVSETSTVTLGAPFVPFQWRAWAVRKRLYSGVGASGRYSLDVFMDGALTQSFENIQNADGGQNAEWYIGKDNNYNSWLFGAADDVWTAPSALTEDAILTAAGGRLYSAFRLATGDVGSLSAPLSFRHSLAKQKCSALKIRITESGGDGLGFSLSSLGFEVGLKRGARKFSGAATKG